MCPTRRIRSALAPLCLWLLPVAAACADGALPGGRPEGQLPNGSLQNGSLQDEGFEAPPLLAAAAKQSDEAEEVSILSENLPAPTPVLEPSHASIKAEIDAEFEANEPAFALPRSQHPWTRFQPGAWRRLRITSEAFDAEGQFLGRSVTERIETLVDVDEGEYTLRSETLVDVGGRRTPGPTDERRLTLLCDSPNEPSSVTTGEPTAISLGDQVAPCETWEVTTPTEAGERSELVCYTDDVSPHILRRERRVLVDGEPRSESVERVVRLGVPIALGEGISSGWHSVGKRLLTSGARNESFTVHCDAVPGGLVSDSSAEFDPTGRRVRWTISQLVASGRTAEENLPATGEAETPPLDLRPRRLLRMLRRGEEPPSL